MGLGRETGMYSKRLVLAMTVMLTAGMAYAQSVISARSGAIHHVEGRALIDGDLIRTEFAEFPNLAENSVLQTERGRVEMLLTPGVIVRTGEDTSVRMIANQLSDTRLEMLGGSALIEVMEILQDNAITFYSNGASIELLKEGLYRIDSGTAQLRVYKGKARVISGDQVLTAKKGKLVDLGGVLVASKFNTKEGDSLYRWSSRRSSYIAMANLSAARSLRNSGVPWSMSAWRWNPYFGMFTFIPASGSYFSPFGYYYWSPARVMRAYNTQRAFSGGGGSASSRGYTVIDRRSVSSSSRSIGSSSIPSSSSSPSPAANSSTRSGGGTVTRGGSSGGRGR